MGTFYSGADVEFCSLADAPVARVRKRSEKNMGQVQLNALQKVVAAQREEAGGAQKVSILTGHADLF